MFVKFLRRCLSPTKQRIKLAWFQVKWRRANANNITVAMNIFPINKVSVGVATYGQLNIQAYGNEKARLRIGNYCSIAPDVLFVLDGGHHYKRCTNYPFPKIPYNMHVDASCKGPIIVEDDVWIGTRATVLSGVTLGRGCVVGACSVVANDIPPYAIFAGGKIIKYRFSQELINKVSKIDFSNIDNDVLTRYLEYCETEINETNIDNILTCFK